MASPGWDSRSEWITSSEMIHSLLESQPEDAMVFGKDAT